MAYSKQPIYAGEAAIDFRKSQESMIKAAEKLEETISLINNNLVGTEFEMASAFVGKIINLMQDEVEDTNSTLDKLTYLINEYNSDIRDENGNKVNVGQVNYHSGLQIYFNGTTGSKSNDTAAESTNSTDLTLTTGTQTGQNQNTQNTSGTNAITYSTGTRPNSSGTNNSRYSSGNNYSSRNTSGTPVTSYTTINQPTSSTVTGHVSDYNDYVVAENQTKLSDYVNFLRSRGICQDSNKDVYGGKCLGFAYTQAYGYFVNDRNITPDSGANYKYATKFQAFEGTKQEVLAEIYKEITAGRPVVLQVNGNVSGTSRHFVTVVGYKKSVKSAADIKEEDLLIIDSWDAKLESMNGKGSGTRFMTQGTETGNGNYPYRIYKMR